MSANTQSSKQRDVGESDDTRHTIEIQSLLANIQSRMWVLFSGFHNIVDISLGEAVLPQNPWAVQTGYFVRPDGTTVYVESIFCSSEAVYDVDKWSTECVTGQRKGSRWHRDPVKCTFCFWNNFSLCRECDLMIWRLNRGRGSQTKHCAESVMYLS